VAAWALGSNETLVEGKRGETSNRGEERESLNAK
jgi:hypothetical protein